MPSISSFRTRSGFTVALILGALMAHATAGETPIYGGPIGGTDIGGAYLPPYPGLYMGVGGVAYRSSRYQNLNGNRIPIDTGFDADAAVAGFNYVYPMKVFGGAVGSSVQGAYGRRCVRFGERHCSPGVADFYSDLFFWSKHIDSGEAAPQGKAPLPYGLTVGGGLGVTIPLGRYHRQSMVSTGGNTWIWSPNLALTYLTRPEFSLGGDGIEASARLYYSMPVRNAATDFDGGSVVNVDWALTQRYGYWQVGLAGQHAKQIGSDRLPTGLKTSATKFEVGSVGPIVSVFVPSMGAQLKLKAAANYDARNTFSGYSIVLVAGWKLF